MGTARAWGGCRDRRPRPARWDAPIAWDDPPALQRLERGLVEAEVKLSAYRRALDERIDACTAQLVDHYERVPPQIVR